MGGEVPSGSQFQILAQSSWEAPIKRHPRSSSVFWELNLCPGFPRTPIPAATANSFLLFRVHSKTARHYSRQRFKVQEIRWIQNGQMKFGKDQEKNPPFPRNCYGSPLHRRQNTHSLAWPVTHSPGPLSDSISPFQSFSRTLSQGGFITVLLHWEKTLDHWEVRWPTWGHTEWSWNVLQLSRLQLPYAPLYQHVQELWEKTLHVDKQDPLKNVPMIWGERKLF